ncbi:MAG: hypothetical protein ACRBFS_04505 [Aureispira sp.]
MTPVPAVLLLMIVYMASMIGFTTPHQQAWYLYYTPYFLLLNALIFLVYQRQWNKSLVFFLGSTLVLGGLVEGLGVHTALYGDYAFGASLGVKMGAVPLIMPIYWLIIVSSTAILAAKVWPKNTVGRLFTGVALSLSLTVLIQQVATRLDFWYLEGRLLWQYIVVQGLIIALLHYLFIRWRVASENNIAGYVYGGLLIFFIGVVSFLKP